MAQAAAMASTATQHDDALTLVIPRLEVEAPRATPARGSAPALQTSFLGDIPLIGKPLWLLSRGIRSMCWSSSRKTSESFPDDYQFIIDLKHMAATGFRFDRDALFGRFRKIPGLLLWGSVISTVALPHFAPTVLACITLLCLMQNVTVMLFATMNTIRGFASMRAAMRRPPPHPRLAHVEEDSPSTPHGRATGLRDAKGALTPQPVDILHLIAICRCTEPVEVLEESLGHLATHDNREAYIIVLALEAKDPNAVAVGEALVRKYGRMFNRVLYAIHQSGVEGEVPGKSANTCFAVRTAAGILDKDLGPAALDRMVVTVCDIDAQVSANYFNALSAKFAAAVRENREVFFAPPMLFNEEAADAAAAAANGNGAAAPALDVIQRSTSSGRIVLKALRGGAIPAPVKIADQMWSMFVLQNLASGNWVKMPCSTYSVGLRLIASVGYWDVGVESIPEDYHTALKLYWGTGGRARCEPIYHPVLYQHIDGGSWLGGVNQRFQQGCRHMWGATDVAYVFWLAARIHNVPLYDRIMIIFTVCDVHLSAAVITFMGSFAFPILLLLRPDWALSEDGLIALTLQKCLTALLLSLTFVTAMTYEWHVTDMVAMCLEGRGGAEPATSPRNGGRAVFGPSFTAKREHSGSIFGFIARLSAWLWAPLVAVLYLLAPASFAQTKLIFTDRMGKIHVSPKSAPAATPTAGSSSSSSLASPLSSSGERGSLTPSSSGGSISASSSSATPLTVCVGGGSGGGPLSSSSLAGGLLSPSCALPVSALGSCTSAASTLLMDSASGGSSEDGIGTPTSASTPATHSSSSSTLSVVDVTAGVHHAHSHAPASSAGGGSGSPGAALFQGSVGAVVRVHRGSSSEPNGVLHTQAHTT